jgi:hypothetical protein
MSNWHAMENQEVLSSLNSALEGLTQPAETHRSPVLLVS